MLCEINIKVMLILHGWVGGIEKYVVTGMDLLLVGVIGT